MSDQQTNKQGLPLSAAAYIAGRYPYWLGTTLDVLQVDVAIGMRSEKRQLLLYRQTVKELRVAFRTLAIARAVDAGILVEAHRELDIFVRHARSIYSSYRASPYTLAPEAYRGCRRASESLMDLTPHLIRSEGELPRLFALGADLSRLALSGEPSAKRPWRRADSGSDPALAEAWRVMDTTNFYELETMNDLLTTQLATRHTGGDNDGSTYYRIVLSCQLSQRILHALTGTSTPEPLLVLDADSIIYKGNTLKFCELQPAQAKLLWVLALNAGRDLNRSTIIREGRIQADTLTLPPVVSRLRKRLAELASESISEGDRPASVIVGRSDKAKKNDGTYRLNLDPLRVQVNPPKPVWMI